MSYPTDSELFALLSTVGMIAGGSDLSYLDFEGAIASAIEDWEEATGFHPFLADAADVTLRYSPSQVAKAAYGRAILDLSKGNGCGGLISITSVTVGVGLGSTGTALTVNTDYYLRPSNAALNSKPYTYIEFLGYSFGSAGLGAVPDSIVIAGKRGYSNTLPASAKRAILLRAASRLQPSIAANVQRGAISWREGDVQRQMGEGGAYSSQSEAWDREYANAVGRYRRVKLA